MKVIGIDPGLTGAVAVIGDGAVLVESLPTLEIVKGKRQLDRNGLVQLVVNVGPIDMVFVEDVHAMPKQGVSSSFNFGRDFGAILGVLAALGRPITLVQPAVWKRMLGCPVGAGKDWSRSRAAQLYPSCADRVARVKDDGRADAILLAHYGLRSLAGQRGAA